MKPIILMLLAATFSFAALAEEKLRVPLDVQKTQKQKYPVNKVLSWEKQGDYYRAYMDISEVQVWANYAADGMWFSTETQIPSEELIQEIVEFAKSMNDQAITFATKIVFSDGSMNYRIRIAEMDFIFDAMGRLIRKENPVKS